MGLVVRELTSAETLLRNSQNWTSRGSFSDSLLPTRHDPQNRLTPLSLRAENRAENRVTPFFPFFPGLLRRYPEVGKRLFCDNAATLLDVVASIDEQGFGAVGDHRS